MCLGGLPWYISVHQIHAVFIDTRRGQRIPWNWAYREWWASMWMLRMEPKFSGRAACAEPSLQPLIYVFLMCGIFMWWKIGSRLSQDTDRGIKFKVSGWWEMRLFKTELWIPPIGALEWTPCLGLCIRSISRAADQRHLRKLFGNLDNTASVNTDAPI